MLLKNKKKIHEDNKMQKRLIDLGVYGDPTDNEAVNNGDKITEGKKKLLDCALFHVVDTDNDNLLSYFLSNGYTKLTCPLKELKKSGVLTGGKSLFLYALGKNFLKYLCY